MAVFKLRLPAACVLRVGCPASPAMHAILLLLLPTALSCAAWVKTAGHSHANPTASHSPMSCPTQSSTPHWTIHLAVPHPNIFYPNNNLPM